MIFDPVLNVLCPPVVEDIAGFGGGLGIAANALGRGAGYGQEYVKSGAEKGV